MATSSLLGAACSGRERTSTPAAPHGPSGQEAPQPDAYSSPLCSGADLRSADDALAAGIVGTDLVLLLASGERRFAASFDAPDGSAASMAARVSTEDGHVTASLGNETVRLGDDLQVLYQLPTYATLASDAGVVVASGGDASFMKADGTSTRLVDPPGSLYLYVSTAPDPQGWMLASWSAPDSASPTHGLVNTDGRRIPFFVEDHTYTEANLAGQYVFLHGGPPYTLTFGSASGVVDVPFAPAPESTSPPAYFWLVGSGPVGVIVSAYDDRLFRVDAVAHTFTRIVPPPGVNVVIDGGALNVAVSEDGGWFVRTDGAGKPLWTYDAAQDRIAVPPVNGIASLRRLDGAYCSGPVTILADGTIGMGLRDDASAGFYEIARDGTARGIGLAFRDVIAIKGRKVQGTWVVTGESGKNTYCPGFTPFNSDPSDPAVLSGDAIEFVAPSAKPLAFALGGAWAGATPEIDPSGLCVFHAGTGSTSTVYDLLTGRRTELGPVQAFAWIK
jgi:hypothetical protein